MASITRVIQRQIYDKLEEKIPKHFKNLGLTIPRIKMGNLQDDPEDVSASFLVHIQDPDNASIYDVPVRSRSNELVPSSDMGSTYGTISQQLYPVGRIGGGRTWIKPYTIEIVQFATGLEQQDAADLCMEVVDFTVDILKTVSISDLKEGSRVGVSIKVDSVRTEEGGGPPSDYHWTTLIRMLAEILDMKG
jgi:hypothetical protein